MGIQLPCVIRLLFRRTLFLDFTSHKPFIGCPSLEDLWLASQSQMSTSRIVVANGEKKAETREPLCLTLVSVAPSGFELFWHVLNMTHQCICSQSYRWICWRPKQPTNPSNILTNHQDRSPLVLPGYWRSKVTNKNNQTSSKTKVHRLNGPKSSLRITSNHHASQDMKSSQHHPKKSSNSENINPEITSNQKIIRKSSENHHQT